MAAAWHEDDADGVAEWAGLKAIVATVLAAGEASSSALLAQIKAAEDRFFMSPLARSKARAQIVEDPVEGDDDDELDSW